MFKRWVMTIVILGLLVIPLLTVKATDGGGAWAQATAYMTKEFGLDLAARVIARNLLNTLVSGLVNKIQTGGDNGGPAFVQNWRNFQTDSQYRGENVFRSMLSSATLCDYASPGIKGVFGANQVVPSPGQNLRTGNFDPFALRSACTMPSNFNLTNYQNDFSNNGGWNAWSRMLEPQNNYYGLLFGSLDEASRQRTLEQSGSVNDALGGSGYTSIKDSCVGSGANAQCTFLGITKTPGDLLGKTAASTIDSDLQWLVSSDELSEVIVSIINASINRLANLATSKTAEDYNNAPGVVDSAANNYAQCMNTCNEFSPSDPYHQTCVLNCSRNSGAPVPDPIENPDTNPGPPEEPSQTGGTCASPEEIAQFLIDNPGDEGRLSEAFPCP